MCICLSFPLGWKLPEGKDCVLFLISIPKNKKKICLILGINEIFTKLNYLTKTHRALSIPQSTLNILVNQITRISLLK